MSKERCIVVGASHAGTTLALQLRREGWQGAITLVGAESELPYHRPPLSKDYLAGRKELDGVRLRPEKAFVDNDIELRLGESVIAIDSEASQLHFKNSGAESYDKLALCVGSSVRKLSLGQELANVFYLRTAADATQLRNKLKVGQKAIVIGAGYIGLEVAAVMNQLGLSVTVLEMQGSVLPRVAGDQIASYVQGLHEINGVEFQFDTSVTALQGDGDVTKVICANGEEFAADIVVVGIGISPNTQLAESAGLIINDGILVDEFTRTSAENIVAAGDCTTHPSLLYNRAIRLESVQNANDQARVAAANLCDKKTVYDAVPWFWSDQYDIKLQSAGLLTGFDEAVLRGDPEAGSGFAVFYLRDGKMLAADCVSRPKEFMAAKQLVKASARVQVTDLQDEAIAPGDWLS